MLRFLYAPALLAVLTSTVLAIPAAAQTSIYATAEAGGGNGWHASGSFLNGGLVYHFHPRS